MRVLVDTNILLRSVNQITHFALKLLTRFRS